MADHAPKGRVAQSGQHASRTQAPASPSTTGLGIEPLASAPALQHPADALALQRALGNAATHHLIQAKLTVGAAHDPLEQEADRVAEQVVSRASIQRNPEEDELLTMRDGMMDSFDAGSDFEQKLSSSGSGSPLDGNTRSQMEAGIGADFRNVRVHTGAQASSLNRSISARAFTRGSDVFFDRGQYNPGSTAGRRLLAHELTHVVQQGAAMQRKAYLPVQRNIIQRYPATVVQSDAGVDWVAQTESVRRSGEGVSGGVYFFNSNHAPKRRVVIKPEYVEGDNSDANSPDIKEQMRIGASTQISDTFLRQMGSSVPNSRLLTHDAPEAQAIIQVAGNKNAPIPTTRVDNNEWPWHLSYIRVMDVAGEQDGNAQSLSSLAEGAANEDGMSRLLSRLNNASLMKKVGNLIAFDSFMSNKDRVTLKRNGTFANIGNIMFSDNDVHAIDNNAVFQNTGGMGADLEQLRNLFSRRDELINGFLSIIKTKIPDEVNRGEYEAKLNLHGDAWRQSLSQGIDEGLARIQRQLSRKNRLGLKQHFAEQWNTFSFQDPEGGTVTNSQEWDRLRERQKYLKLRAAGLDETEARRGLDAYERYRKSRSHAMTGMKWITKLEYKAGWYNRRSKR